MILSDKERLIDKIVGHILVVADNNNSEILAVRLSEYNVKWLRQLESTLDCLANEPIED